MNTTKDGTQQVTTLYIAQPAVLYHTGLTPTRKNSEYILFVPSCTLTELDSETKLSTNFLIFLVGYTINSAVTISLVYVKSVVCHWVTKSLSSFILGLGREDPCTSSLLASTDVVASRALLYKLFLLKNLKFVFWVMQFQILLLVVTADKWHTYFCRVKLAAPL
jgi:hypothetical protein